MENIEDYTAFQYDICMDVMNDEPTIEKRDEAFENRNSLSRPSKRNSGT